MVDYDYDVSKFLNIFCPSATSYLLLFLITLECMVVKQELLSICSCLYAQQAKTTGLILFLQLKYVCKYVGALKLAHLLR